MPVVLEIPGVSQIFSALCCRNRVVRKISIGCVVLEEGGWSVATFFCIASSSRYTVNHAFPGGPRIVASGARANGKEGGGYGYG